MVTNTEPNLPDTEAAHERSSAPWADDPFGWWAAIRLPRQLLVGSLVLASLCTVLAFGLRINAQNTDWAVPALNYAGGLLLTGGLLVYVGRQIRPLLVPVGALVTVALPYVVLVGFSETLAMTAGLFMGLVFLLVMGVGVIGFRREQVRRRRSSANAARSDEPPQAAIPAEPVMEPSLDRDEPPTMVVFVFGYSGAVMLTLGFLADVL